MTHSMHDWNTVSFSASVMKTILSQPLADETPTNRIKQIGFMGVIYQMHLMNMDTSVRSIMEISNLSRAGIFEVAGPLIERGLLAEEMVLNAAGRGRATRLYIPDQLFARVKEISPFPNL